MQLTQTRPKPATAKQAPDSCPPPELPAGRLAAAVAVALLAGWIAAGSIGLMGHAFRHALTWTALVALLCVAWPTRPPLVFPFVPACLRACVPLVAAITSIVLLYPTNPAINLLSLPIILSALGVFAAPPTRRILNISALSLLALAIYRLACTGIPTLWLLADSIGALLGKSAAALLGRPLSVGATFAGLDFLIPMAILVCAVVASSPRPRIPRAIYCTLAVLGAQLLYFAALICLPLFMGAPPEGDQAKSSWLESLRPLIPWNIPALGGIAHALVATAIILWIPQRPAESSILPRTRRNLLIAAACAALLLPITTSLWIHRPALAGRKIVLYEKGFLNWLKPKHGDYGRLSIGMYGMMPQYLRSLGADVVVSRDLSDNDLAGASVLALIFPNKPWEEGQLERIDRFVRNGGSLLVLGEHTVHEDPATSPIGDKADSRFNDALKSTSMYVRFDSATFQVGGWLQSYEAIQHPTSAGIPDDRNQLGAVIGASVSAHWPARPLIVGRWGWCDPGDAGADAAMMGNHRYDGGERLGDVLLAAEQRIGAGRVIAFGDTSGFTNGITFGSHIYTSRLWAYLADTRFDPQPIWRQLLAILLAAGLIAGVVMLSSIHITAGASLILGLCLILCIHISAARSEVIPDGFYAKETASSKTENLLAYIASSNLESSSEESWRPDGTMGLAMNLMRCGFLTLSLPEIDADRLDRAALLIQVAPRRPFTRSERRTIRRFVENGGIYILTVGYDESSASRDLLRDFGLWVGSPVEPDDPSYIEPVPLGHFKSPFIKVGDYMAHVRFDAGWTIDCESRNDRPQDLPRISPPDLPAQPAQVIAYGSGNSPIILSRPVGKGRFVLVGDTGFAMNKNLEHEGGEPFEGMRENADFWRWFIGELTGHDPWLPKPPAPPEPAEAPAAPSATPAGPPSPAQEGTR